MVNISALSDAELRQNLIEYGHTPGPVTAATRSLLEKKLQKLVDAANGITPTKKTPAKKSTTPKRTPSASPSRSRAPQHEEPLSINDSIADEPDAPSRRSPGRPKKSAPSTPVVQQTSSVHSKPVTPSYSKPSTPATSKSTYSTFSKPNTPASVSKPISPPKTSSFKRTPTPTRPTYQKNRSPPSVIDSNIFDNSKNSLGGSYSQAEDEDDHFESSRLLTPEERINFGSARKSKTSPLDKLRSFGSSAVGFLQRSDKKYVNHPSERGVYGTPGGRYSPISKRDSREQIPASTDVPKIALICFLSFTFILAITYFFTANTETLHRGKEIVFGTVYELGSFVYNYAVLPIILVALAVGVVSGLFYLYRTNKVSKEKFEAETMNLVDQIAERVRSAGIQGVAEQHIRDKVFPPTRRTANEWKLWEAAAEFINSTDSRIRSESQLINGVECNVWIWVTAENEKVNEQPEGPSRCLKIRGLIAEDFTSENLGKVKKYIYGKAAPAKPSHYGEDLSSDSAIFVAFDNNKESYALFQKLNNKLINGNNVLCKYMMDDRYEARFPEWIA